MADYDKVVKGIEYHLDGRPTCQGCVYLDVWPCLDAILKDALALIREQQKENVKLWSIVRERENLIDDLMRRPNNEQA